MLFLAGAQTSSDLQRRFHSATRSHQIPLIVNLKVGTVPSTDSVCCSGVSAMVPNNAVERVLKRFHTDMWVSEIRGLFLEQIPSKHFP